MALQLFKIASVEVATPQASIDFTSIPSGYTDLLVLVSGRAASGSPELLMNLNNSSANFTVRYLQGSGSGAASNNLARTYLGELNYSTRTANTFCNISVYIPNYTGSNYKAFSAESVEENNATQAYSQLIAGLWSNTAAVNQITLYCSSSLNFAAGSTATLYGVM